MVDGPSVSLRAIDRMWGALLDLAPFDREIDFVSVRVGHSGEKNSPVGLDSSLVAKGVPRHERDAFFGGSDGENAKRAALADLPYEGDLLIDRHEGKNAVDVDGLEARDVFNRKAGGVFDEEEVPVVSNGPAYLGFGGVDPKVTKVGDLRGGQFVKRSCSATYIQDRPDSTGFHEGDKLSACRMFHGGNGGGFLCVVPVNGHGNLIVGLRGSYPVNVAGDIPQLVSDGVEQ